MCSFPAREIGGGSCKEHAATRIPSLQIARCCEHYERACDPFNCDEGLDHWKTTSRAQGKLKGAS